MSTDLPVISRPTSPEFPSIVRSRASSSCPPLAAPLLPQVNQTLQKQKGKLASSCPQLPSAETKGQRLLRREQEEEKFLARQLQHSGLQTRRQRSIVQREYLQRSRDADDIEFLGAKGKDGFRTFLQKKFGSILKGWRAIDSDNSGRLGFHEFCHACRAVGFHGNFKKLWSELDVKQSGTVSLMEVDSEVGKYIRTFKVALMKRYGDLATAWFQCIDVSKDGQVQEPALAKAVERLGLDMNPAKLFNILRGPSSKGVSLFEFDPETWKRHMAGGLPPIHQENEPAKKEEQLDKAKSSQLADSFRQALCHQFGTLLAAWREALDVDGKGKLTFGEFCFLLNRLGLHYEVRSLWLQLTDRDFLQFRDLDPETDEMLTELREKLTKEYQNMLLAWVKGLDTKGNGWVTEKQFVHCCRKVGFAGNAAELFRRMQPDTGRGLMSVKDFDTKAFHALSRGDFRMLSEPNQGYHGKSPMELTFHERNEASFFNQMQRATKVSRCKEFAKACGTSSTNASLKTIEDFESLCVRKCGSVLVAWRRCLDQHASGKLSFGEFCEALRRLGYAGDFKSLFRDYDKQQKGFVCLGDIDPEADLLVSDFLSLLGDRFGTLDIAWKDGFHQDPPHGSVSKEEVVEVCSSLGYKHDAEKLFKCLSPQKNLTIWDLDPACSQKLQSGHNAIISGGNALEKTFLEDASLTSRNQKTFYSFMSPGQLQQLHTALKRCFGSTVVAWRSAFDPQNHGTCGFGIFMKALEECAFSGKAKSLWEELSGQRHFLTFHDLDCQAASLLDSMREQLVDKFGSLMDAWDHLEEAACGLLDEESFVKSLDSVGVMAKRPKTLFKLLLSWPPAQRSLVMEDFQALLIGVPLAEQEVLWRSKKPRKQEIPTKAKQAAKAVPKKRVRQVEPANKQTPKVVVSAPEPSKLPATEANQECSPQSREVARSIATQAVDEVVCTVAVNLNKTEAAGKSQSTTFAREEREAPQGSAPSARKKFAAKLLSAAKDGSLEKSLKDFESEAGHS